MSLGLNSLNITKFASGTSFTIDSSMAVKPSKDFLDSSGFLRTKSTPFAYAATYFLTSAGLDLIRVVTTDAVPPNHGASASSNTYLEITPVSRMRVIPFTLPIVPVGSSV